MGERNMKGGSGGPKDVARRQGRGVRDDPPSLHDDATVEE